MPGAIQAITSRVAVGWARHPKLPGYAVVVHVVLRGQVVHSTLADQPESDEAANANRHWFTIDLPALALAEGDGARVSFLLGETDETLPIAGRDARMRSAYADQTVRVEDILGMNAGRPWVTGATWHDAAAAGVPHEDVIDLFYLDILGRPADASGLGNYMRRLTGGETDLDGIRRSLLESEEYAARRVPVGRAPGAIFSQKIALSSTGRVAGSRYPGQRVVRMDNLGNLDAEAFVTAIFRDVLHRRLPTVDARRALIDRLRGGTRRETLLRELVADHAGPERDEIVLAGAFPEPIPTTSPGVVEFDAGSTVFETGWYPPDPDPAGTVRWMGSTGTIVNPHPGWPVTSVTLRLRNVYGAATPVFDAQADAATLSTDAWTGAQGGFRIELPIPVEAALFQTLAMQARASGCPLTEGKGNDPRTISLLVEAVVFHFAEHKQ